MFYWLGVLLDLSQLVCLLFTCLSVTNFGVIISWRVSNLRITGTVVHHARHIHTYLIFEIFKLFILLIKVVQILGSVLRLSQKVYLIFIIVFKHFEFLLIIVLFLHIFAPKWSEKIVELANIGIIIQLSFILKRIDFFIRFFEINQILTITPRSFFAINTSCLTLARTTIYGWEFLVIYFFLQLITCSGWGNEYLVHSPLVDALAQLWFPDIFEKHGWVDQMDFVY